MDQLTWFVKIMYSTVVRTWALRYHCIAVCSWPYGLYFGWSLLLYSSAWVHKHSHRKTVTK